jgi:hypothetical protein
VLISPTTLFRGAVAFFLLVKLAWVLLPVFPMGVPRLGDDALVYLWSANSSVVAPQDHRPDIQGIVALRQLDDAPSAALEFARARVTMRTTSISASPLAITMGALLKLRIETKFAFAFFEVLTAVFLSLGLAYFLAIFFGYEGASFALMTLTFALLPNQGIHYLIPSVFVLALALVMWTLVLKQGRLWFAISALSALMLLLHTIGQVYVLVALSLIAGRVIENRRFATQDVVGILALLAGVLIWFAVNWVSGAKSAPTGGMGGVVPTMALANLEALGALIVKFFSSQPILGALSVAGLWVVLRYPSRDRGVSLLTVIVAAALVSTTVVDLPGYPAELPSRILVVIVVIGLGGSGMWFSERMRASDTKGLWFAAVPLLVVATQFPFFYSYFYSNLNGRYQVIDETKFRSQLLSLPDRATILWGDADIQMMTALLLDNGKHKYIPLSMVAVAPALEKTIQDRDSLYVTAPYPERLNGLSTLGWRSLKRRYYGYGFKAYKRLSLNSGEKPIGDFYVRGTRGYLVELSVFVSDPKRKCSVAPFRDASGDADNEWVRVSGCPDAATVELESQDEHLVITGLSFDKPSEKKRWPWGGDGLKIRAEPRDHVTEATVVQFDWRYLFSDSVASELARLLEKIELTDDASGVIWFHAVSKKHYN